MELNWNNFLLKTSNLVTVSSYIKGTVIFTLFTISSHKNEEMMILGLYFLGIVFLINLLILLLSLGTIFITKQYAFRMKLWCAIGYQLLNIPIAIAYSYFVIQDINKNFIF